MRHLLNHPRPGSPPPRHPGPGAPRAKRAIPPLTRRERDALTAIAIGLNIDTAARRLGISEKTLRRATTKAMIKLGGRSTIHAVALAVMHGRIDSAVIAAHADPLLAWRRPVDPAVLERARTLTAREREVMSGIARGDRPAAIAPGMNVKVDTVRQHLYRALTKLGAHSQREGADLLLRAGLVNTQGDWHPTIEERRR